MSSFNSPVSFREQELLFEEVPKELTDPGIYEDIKISLDKVFRKEHEFLESLAQSANSAVLSLEDKIKTEKENQDRKREKKNLLIAKVFTAKQSLDELSLKKSAMKADNIEQVSKDELTEMLQKVVQLEREKEIKQDDMKMKMKVFIGKMLFYKEYLNVYIDIPNSNDFILFFRRWKAEDNNKPQERIRIITDDFKKFLVLDISSRGNLNDELLKKITASDKHLRELIIEARELCLNVV